MDRSGRPCRLLVSPVAGLLERTFFGERYMSYRSRLVHVVAVGGGAVEGASNLPPLDATSW